MKKNPYIAILKAESIGTRWFRFDVFWRYPIEFVAVMLAAAFMIVSYFSGRTSGQPWILWQTIFSFLFLILEVGCYVNLRRLKPAGYTWLMASLALGLFSVLLFGILRLMASTDMFSYMLVRLVVDVGMNLTRCTLLFIYYKKRRYLLRDYSEKELNKALRA